MSDVDQYNPGGRLEHWQEEEALRNPQLASKYTELLFGEGILPSSRRSDGFVLLSPSANQGMFEYEFAEKMDASIRELPSKTPLFLAADMFGDKTNGHFVPGFWKEYYQGKFKNVVFNKLSADARSVPVADGSVDVVWDRLGALWHAQNIRVISENLSIDPISELLDEYDRILKPGGAIVTDAATKTQGATNSTANFLQGNFKVDGKKINGKDYKVDLEEFGWKMAYLGSDETRLAVLRRKDDRGVAK